MGVSRHQTNHFPLLYEQVFFFISCFFVREGETESLINMIKNFSIEGGDEVCLASDMFWGGRCV